MDVKTQMELFIAELDKEQQKAKCTTIKCRLDKIVQSLERIQGIYSLKHINQYSQEFRTELISIYTDIIHSYTVLYDSLLLNEIITFIENVIDNNNAKFSSGSV